MSEFKQSRNDLDRLRLEGVEDEWQVGAVGARDFGLGQDEHRDFTELLGKSIRRVNVLGFLEICLMYLHLTHNL